MAKLHENSYQPPIILWWIDYFSINNNEAKPESPVKQHKENIFFWAVLFFLGFEHILKSDESKLTVKIFMGYHQY